jgi:hypothetical protein
MLVQFLIHSLFLATVTLRQNPSVCKVFVPSSPKPKDSNRLRCEEIMDIDDFLVPLGKFKVLF